MPRRLEWNSWELFAQTPHQAVLRNRPAALEELIPPGLEQIDQALAARRTHAREYIDRSTFVESLRESHKRRNAPQAVLDAIERLTQDNAFLVIAGQQPGLLGGPLLTWYKALHAIALARRLSAARQDLFLPAFWNASEDHDVSEINSAVWMAKNQLKTFNWDLPDNKRPYFSIPAGECPLADLRQRILETTNPSEFRDALLDEWIKTENQATRYPDLFDQWLWSWLGEEGLIILRPDDEFVRNAARPILQREIETPTRTTRSVEESGAILEQAGLAPQIHKREDRTAFFLLRDNRREAVYHRGGAFVLESGDTFTQDQLLSRLEEPSLFSPSAILRPVVQDALFPTAAVILGPSELAYHFMLQGVYDAHGVPRPVVAPRFGFTLVESRDRKIMEKYGISLSDLRDSTAALLKRWMREHESDIDITPVESAIDGYFDSLKSRAQSVDPTIIPALDKNRQKVLKEIRNSEALLVRREADRHQTARSQIETLQSALLPGGVPQERTLSLLHYWIKYGPEFLRSFTALAMEIEDGAHVFVQVP